MKLGMTVGVLLDTLDADELHEWLEFSRLEPWGEDRADLRAGIIAATVAQVNGVRCQPSDFLPKFGEQSEEPTEMSDEDILSAIVKTNALLGGKFVKG